MRYFTTLLIFIIFFWMWPVRLFISQNNCYFWTLEKLVARGGSVNWYRSKTWRGFHCTWVERNGNEWEYTVPRMGRKPWWYVPLFYNGKVKQVKNGKGVRKN